ncbi:hypothetical protein LTR78_010974 [Recurvomyces mirabilis]|uniref:Uncharacterized protein n=1 Tax=Recurvomyces mirabilis TaxID=574656 RepID=A0AAE0TLT9_9PEZI|nr:hypothetical protein LTR78_010974 [Recurvomyces mirabilis]KAK5152089.1 hypothetical protein LTS14_008864 [Recurvomyces mirabilis]
MSNQLIDQFGSGDAKRYPGDTFQKESKEPFHESSKPHAHEVLDSKDQRSLKNKLARYEHDEHTSHEQAAPVHFVSEETAMRNEIHPDENKPQKEHEKKGAIIDRQLAEEDTAKSAEMDAKIQAKKCHEHKRHKEHRQSKQL